jgi:hypothetical protein
MHMYFFSDRVVPSINPMRFFISISHTPQKEKSEIDIWKSRSSESILPKTRNVNIAISMGAPALVKCRSTFLQKHEFAVSSSHRQIHLPRNHFTGSQDFGVGPSLSRRQPPPWVTCITVETITTISRRLSRTQSNYMLRHSVSFCTESPSYIGGWKEWVRL